MTNEWEIIETELKLSSIIVWGIGRHFETTVLPFLKDAKLLSSVQYFVDASPSLQHKEYFIDDKKVSIISPDELENKVKDNTIFVIAPIVQEDIIKSIKKHSNSDHAKIYWGEYLAAIYADYQILNVNKPPNGYRGGKEMRIPKVIHTFWFSGKKIPEKYRKYVDTWEKYCPDYNIRIWTLDDYDGFDCRYFRQTIENKKWAFASDYARVDIIYRMGGIYMDMDVEVLRSLDDLLYNDAYMGFEDMVHIECGSGFGSTAGNRIMGEIRETYLEIPFVLPDGSYDLTTCPSRYSEIMKRHGLQENGSFQTVDNITVYPFECLTAKSLRSGRVYITDNTYTVHHHNGSWINPEIKKKAEKRYVDINQM